MTTMLLSPMIYHDVDAGKSNCHTLLCRRTFPNDNSSIPTKRHRPSNFTATPMNTTTSTTCKPEATSIHTSCLTHSITSNSL